MISIREEYLKDMFDELKVLAKEHFEEVEEKKSVIELDPDYDKYLSLEENDMTLVIVARDENEEMVGYMINFLYPHMHHKGRVSATTDLIYIKPEFRGNGTASTMVKLASVKLKQRGAIALQIGMKLTHDFGKLLEKQNFEFIEKIYQKVFIEEKH